MTMTDTRVYEAVIDVAIGLPSPPYGPGGVERRTIAIAHLGERTMRSHYFGGRFRCVYPCQFARGIDGALYRTAPTREPRYPEEVEFDVEWLKNEDVMFYQDKFTPDV